MTEIFDNIRKIYDFSAPCAELADCIEFFSESSPEKTVKHTDNACFTVKMFPSWTPTIYINLGSSYQLLLNSSNYLIGPADDVLILRNSVVERQNLPTDHILTVKFHPGGLESIFGINQAKFADKVVNLNTIMSAQFIQKIKGLNTFEERVKMLQGFFLDNYKRKKTQDHYLKFVHNTIEAYGSAGMQFKNSELAEKMFTTSKTINRYFNNVIGASPKHYFSILRTRTALTAYIDKGHYFSPFDYGYYDMSHFYKDVVKFTGKKLRENVI